jgi:hypothetical protein
MKCPVCDGADLQVFLEVERVPVLCNQLFPTRRAALEAPRGAIRLGFCDQCCAIYNTAFDDSLIEYGQAYENSLHFSHRFQRYAEELVAGLVDRFGLRGKDIVEIGCGKGDFLTMICAAGANRGVGFDRSYEGPEAPDGSGFRVVRDHYSEQYAHVPADLICCRHVLEHIPTPIDFLSSVRRAAGQRTETGVFFEVPNALYTLRDLGIWDIIYEHCSYYSAPSLVRLFRDRGFNVRRVYETYGGQFLCLEADSRSAADRSEEVELDGASVARLVSAFSEHHARKVAEWDVRLGQWLEDGARVAIWGAGSKGVTFLNTLGDGARVEFVVDINPRKRGGHVPGTGQPVVAPEQLRGSGVDRVLVMNPLYRDEIGATLRELGVDAETAVV